MLLFIVFISEGDFYTVCKAHFKKFREERPTFGSSSQRGIIDELAPGKDAACKDLLWHFIPELSMGCCFWVCNFPVFSYGGGR
jgi:hypothetical protein